jgi:hypothetical protein
MRRLSFTASAWRPPAALTVTATAIGIFEHLAHAPGALQAVECAEVAGFGGLASFCYARRERPGPMVLDADWAKVAELEREIYNGVTMPHRSYPDLAREEISDSGGKVWLYGGGPPESWEDEREWQVAAQLADMEEQVELAANPNPYAPATVTLPSGAWSAYMIPWSVYGLVSDGSLCCLRCGAKGNALVCVACAGTED